jgi:hypothetical protein
VHVGIACRRAGNRTAAASLSVKTVQNLHYQIKSKLGVDSDIELTRLALSWGLDLEPVRNTGN